MRQKSSLDDTHAAELAEAAIQHAQPLAEQTLAAANKADDDAAVNLRMIASLSLVSDPSTIDEAMREGSPLNIALRIKERGEVSHKIDISPHLLSAADQASRETGINRKLLLAILWQEQQKYQNIHPKHDGPISHRCKYLNRIPRETIFPDKSAGIIHLKPATARAALEDHPEFFPMKGEDPRSLSDSDIVAYIETHPAEAIRVSAFHLAKLRDGEGPGNQTAKDLFRLYAADTPAVRDLNEKAGADDEPRGAATEKRSVDYEEIMPYVEDALEWNQLSKAQRQEAFQAIKEQTPKGQHVELNPIFTSHDEWWSGTGFIPASRQGYGSGPAD